MPLARYFLLVGGVLLALLFIADACLPKPPVADSANTELPAIRIHSDEKWPGRVVYDTGLPTITPAPLAEAQPDAPAPATVVDVTAKQREAYAQLQSSDPKKVEPKLQRRRKIARRRAVPPRLMVARQPQFGWFGSGIW